MKRKFTLAGLVVLLLMVVAAVAGVYFYYNLKDYNSVFRERKGDMVCAGQVVKESEGTPAELAKAQEEIDELLITEQKEYGGNGISSWLEKLDEKAASASIHPSGGPSHDSFMTEMNPLDDDRVNILFLGLDRTLDRDKTLGVYRTDVITLVSINMHTKQAQILSIPRDTYVYIPKIKKMDKINHAYVWGGMGDRGIKSTINTVNRFLKYTRIDYYFCIDMEPIPQIVDDLGGVELEVDVDMLKYGYNLHKGRQLLDGKKAMQYIRWRHSGAGDIDRIKRQRKFCSAMLAKIKSSDQLMNTVKIISKYGKHFKTNMKFQQLVSFTMLAMDIPSGNTSYHIVPGKSSIRNNIWYWVPNEENMEKIRKALFGA